MTRNVTTTLAIVVALALTGCSSFFGPTPEEQAQAEAWQQDIAVNEAQTASTTAQIDSLRWHIDDLKNSLTAEQTEEETTETVGQIESFLVKLEELAGNVRTWNEEHADLSAKVDAVLAPGAGAEEVGDAITAGTTLLPPPFNAIGGLVGMAIAGFGADRLRKRRGDKQLTGVVKSVEMSRDGNGGVNWTEAGTLQEIMGVRAQVRKITDAIEKQRRDAKDVVNGATATA